MASREEPLAEFVRLLIGRWEASGQSLRSLKLAAGWTKSNSQVDQIKKGSSVTEYTGSKLAAPLGYRDFPTLVSAAYTWWGAKQRGEPEPVVENSALTLAIQTAREYGVTGEQIERVIQSVPLDQRELLSDATWLQGFLQARAWALEVDRDLLAAGRAAAATERSNKKKQAAHRAVRDEAKARERDERARPKHKDRAG